jgi:hypothetical protein
MDIAQPAPRRNGGLLLEGKGIRGFPFSAYPASANSISLTSKLLLKLGS